VASCLFSFSPQSRPLFSGSQRSASFSSPPNLFQYFFFSLPASLPEADAKVRKPFHFATGGRDFFLSPRQNPYCRPLPSKAGCKGTKPFPFCNTQSRNLFFISPLFKPSPGLPPERVAKVRNLFRPASAGRKTYLPAAPLSPSLSSALHRPLPERDAKVAKPTAIPNNTPGKNTVIRTARLKPLEQRTILFNPPRQGAPEENT